MLCFQVRQQSLILNNQAHHVRVILRYSRSKLHQISSHNYLFQDLFISEQECHDFDSNLKIYQNELSISIIKIKSRIENPPKENFNDDSYLTTSLQLHFQILQIILCAQRLLTDWYWRLL